MIIIPSSRNGTSKLKASHFFLPHGLKLRPALSRAIFAINSTFMIQFCLFPMKYHCEVQIAFSRKLKFQVSPEKLLFLFFSLFNRSTFIPGNEMRIYVGMGLRTKRATLKTVLFAWFTASKKAIRHSAGLVLAAII